MADQKKSSGKKKTARTGAAVAKPGKKPGKADKKVVAPATAAKPAAVRAAKPAPAKVQSSAVKSAAAKVATVRKPAAADRRPSVPVLAKAPLASAAISSLVTNIVETIDEIIPQKGTWKMENTAKKFADSTKQATAKIDDYTKELQAKAQAFGDKGMKAMNETTDFTKANAEAFVESTKIAFAAIKELSQSNIAFAKKSIEEASAELSKLASIKSPTELLTLQGELARKSLDDAVAQGSKNVEAMISLMNEAFQPLSSRIAVVAEKLKVSA